MKRAPWVGHGPGEHTPQSSKVFSNHNTRLPGLDEMVPEIGNIRCI